MDNISCPPCNKETGREKRIARPFFFSFYIFPAVLRFSRSSLPSDASYRTYTGLPLLLGEQDRATRRRQRRWCISRMREIRNASRGNAKGRRRRRVLLKIRAQGTRRNGKLFRRRRDISAADGEERRETADTTRMSAHTHTRTHICASLKISRDIILISECTLSVARWARQDDDEKRPPANKALASRPVKNPAGFSLEDEEAERAKIKSNAASRRPRENFAEHFPPVLLSSHLGW